ncbi:MAG: hypothetical protein ACO213_05315 [Steroidobacteraceae bacterium]
MAGTGVGKGRRQWLHLAALLLLSIVAIPAHAVNCSDPPYFGVIDGDVFPTPPSQIQVDQNCRVSNYPPSNPLTTNFSFLTQPGQTDDRWLIIFNNVFHTGQMSCNSVANHKIWFVNGSSSTIQENCQNLLIPVEKIDKQNPPGNNTATHGVPFTYRLTLPVLYDPATGTVLNEFGSGNELYGVVLRDNLNETGADLAYVSHVAYWKDSGDAVPHTFSNDAGLLTFDNFPIIPPDRQVVIDLTVVLENTPANVPGRLFVNTAKWDFGRLVEGVFYEPLPGEWGISEPMTIVAPVLEMTKTGPDTLNYAEWGNFTLDVRNSGGGDAWNTVLRDRLPDTASGGTCQRTPEILSVQVFASDGVTPVAGKGPLQPGVDYALSWSGAPACQLELGLTSPAGVIGAGERLIVSYRTQLDTDTQDGASLTNVAGAVEWSNGAPSNPNRSVYLRSLTDGTVGTVDHQDAHTVSVALEGNFFEKTVANLSSGDDPAATAAPGDRLRYTLRIQTTRDPLVDTQVIDELDALNGSASFVPGSLQLLSWPAGADPSNTSAVGGTRGTGLIDIRNLDLAAFSEAVIQFEVTLATALNEGTVVANQSALRDAGGALLLPSDDPFVNGSANPLVAGDEDPTRVLIELPDPSPLVKANTQDTASVGEVFSYRLTVPAEPFRFPLYDLRITDNLAASAADLEFVSVTRVSGSQPWTPANSGTGSNLVIGDAATGIDVPAGEQVVLEIAVRVTNSPTNVPGLEFTNTADYTYNWINASEASRRAGGPGTTAPMTLVGPDELLVTKSGPPALNVAESAVFTVDVTNPSSGTAWGVVVTDLLPDTAEGGMCEAAPQAWTAQVFEADGTTAVSAPLVEGSDFSVNFAGAPDCRVEVRMLTAAAAVGPGQRLILGYQARPDADSLRNAQLTNVAGATEWLSADPAAAAGQAITYTRVLTDGTVGTVDHEDAHTVLVGRPVLRFEKTVSNLNSGANPAISATPGDRLRYRLEVENLDAVEVPAFSLVDELDALNSVAAFASGSLDVVTLPAGADASASDPAGGGRGTGLLDISGLSLGAGETIVVEFEATLAAVIANGSQVANQSGLRVNDITVALSDDPNVNGPADPDLQGDEDPTVLTITSAPAFQVLKTSADLSGDPGLLLAGETLRYTLTVRNLGTDDASDVRLTDQVPANTRYLSGSTILNGTRLADLNDRSPLVDGLLINAPGAPAGSLAADPSGTSPDVAVITFDVLVDETAADGTVIANQGFVSAPAGGVNSQPSDDPDTPIVDDPTRDIVGALPLLFADKRVELLDDLGSPGVIDPNDTLRYTITVFNTGSVEATEASLTDQVPANTTYVPGTTSLNGTAVADGGAFPLAAGLVLAATGGTPGVLGAGESAVVSFVLQVNAGTPAGTLISNQAVVATNERPDLLTDGDGDPATGPEPTVVVVGDAQQLAITKEVLVVGGGAALPGATLEYSLRVTNIGTVPATDVVITDDLNEATPGALSYVTGSASLDGSAAAVDLAGSVLSANYSAAGASLAPGAVTVLRFRAVMGASLAVGTTVTNTGRVAWNVPTQTAQASVSLQVGGQPGVGSLGGSAWHDANFDDLRGIAERALEGWTVELLQGDRLLYSGLTDAEGAYLVTGLEPNEAAGATPYQIRFRAPGAGARTAALGVPTSPFTNRPHLILGIVVPDGGNLVDLNLPIDPNGVVYDSVTRAPIAGATVTLLDAGSGSPLPEACFDDPIQQGQVTPRDGYYKFDLNFADPACASGGDYLIALDAGNASYLSGYSDNIPPTSGPATLAFDVPSCPGGPDDAVPATVDYCEAQVSEFAPDLAVPARSVGTTYHVHLRLSDLQVPGSSQLYNNHLPLDPDLSGVVAITKTTPSLNVTRGQLVPYTITVTSSAGFDLSGLRIVDRFPAGFAYIEGSARIDGVPVEPVRSGLELNWSGVTVPRSSTITLRMLLAVGAGVTEGEYTNRVFVENDLTGVDLTGEASATVRVVPDPTFDCTDVFGKVYDDRDRNGQQDPGEAGIGGVRLVTARGLAATTDAHGRFHITCAVVPNESRGSNFILKLDDRSLPSGFRLVGDATQVKRATRGKALKFNYGASVHRVVGIDLADDVFEPGTTDIRIQWQARLPMLVEELKKAPAILRLTYLADVEDESLVDQRMKVIKATIEETWEALDCCYRLTIEPEVFWRLGGPVNRGEVRP